MILHILVTLLYITHVYILFNLVSFLASKLSSTFGEFYLYITEVENIRYGFPQMLLKVKDEHMTQALTIRCIHIGH